MMPEKKPSNSIRVFTDIFARTCTIESVSCVAHVAGTVNTAFGRIHAGSIRTATTIIRQTRVDS
jgi:hypothetical protein